MCYEGFNIKTHRFLKTTLSRCHAFSPSMTTGQGRYIAMELFAVRLYDYVIIYLHTFSIAGFWESGKGICV